MDQSVLGKIRGASLIDHFLPCSVTNKTECIGVYIAIVLRPVTSNVACLRISHHFFCCPSGNPWHVLLWLQKRKDLHSCLWSTADVHAM